MRLYITHFWLVLNWLFLLTGCKAGEKVVSNNETTIEVRHRDIPVVIPERKASVTGLIKVDTNGHFSLSHIQVANDRGVEIDAHVTEDGSLSVDFTVPEDTTRVSATDSTFSVIKENDKETVRGPSFLQRFGAYIGWSAFGALVIIGIVLFLRYKLKRLWQ